ncbi:MAG TPA: hypothetical protein VGF14_08125 [Alphaproteobacteria bacterium]
MTIHVTTETASATQEDALISVHVGAVHKEFKEIISGSNFKFLEKAPVDHNTSVDRKIEAARQERIENCTLFAMRELIPNIVGKTGDDEKKKPYALLKDALASHPILGMQCYLKVTMLAREYEAVKKDLKMRYNRHEEPQVAEKQGASLQERDALLKAAYLIMSQQKPKMV